MKTNDKKRRRYFRKLKLAIQMELREHRSSFLVYASLRLLVIATMILQIFNRNYENVFLCALTLLLLIVPSLIQVTMKVEIPITLEIIILVFIFAAEILGEIQEFYMVFPFWDTLLHTLNGFLAAAIGFSLVDLLNRSKQEVFHLSPVFVSVVSFCFSMTIGVLWEFFECLVDLTFGLDMQKDTVVHAIHSVMLDPQGHNVPHTITNITEVSVNGIDLNLGGYLDIGLLDTMNDLFVNFIGALVFCTFGYFYLKHRGKGNIVRNLVPRRKEQEQDFLRIVEEEMKADQDQKKNKSKKENENKREE